MRQLTLKELELAIVRVCERYPNRVGPKGCYHEAPDSHCVLGQVGLDSGMHNHSNKNLFCNCETITGTAAPFGTEQWQLIRAAMRLNDSGCEWGYIPYLLGLVPGEGPCCDSADGAVPADHGEVVCKVDSIAGSTQETQHA